MSARTHPPTPRRLREARLRGDVASSRELTGAAALAGGAAALAATGPGSARALAASMAAALARAGDADPAPAAALLAAGALLARLAIPVCAAAAAGAAAAGLVQTGALFAPGIVGPKLARLHPGKGLANLVSADRLVATALGVARAAAVLGLGWHLLAAWAPAFGAAPRAGVTALLALGASFSARAGATLGAALAALGLLDLALARRRRNRRLRMSREEVVRERRDDEGDPRHRGERRRLHRALAAAGPVRQATCVVVNPTHIAVALRHGEDLDAPIVLAKAVGAGAARLRAQARRASVPVVRDVALARALYRLADVGEEIPEALYDAAAAVLVHVRGLRAEDLT